mgnify:CR=1 FL=1
MKRAILAGATLAGLVASTGVFAQALFTLPADAITSTTAYIGDIVDSLGPFLWLAIGIPLGFYVIRRVKSLIVGR